MDHIDNRLIDTLFDNCRIPYQELADIAGLSVSSVWNRITNLLDSETITFIVEIHNAYIGADIVLGIVNVDGTKDEEALLESVAKIPNVVQITGVINRRFALNYQVTCKKELEDGIRQLRAIDSIIDFEIHMGVDSPEVWDERKQNLKIIEPISVIEAKTLQLLREDPRAGSNTIAKRLGISRKKAKRVLDQIIDSGQYKFTVRFFSNRNERQSYTVRIKWDSDITSAVKLDNIIKDMYGDNCISSFESVGNHEMFVTFIFNDFDTSELDRKKMLDINGVLTVESIFPRAGMQLPLVGERLLDKLIDDILSKEE